MKASGKDFKQLNNDEKDEHCQPVHICFVTTTKITDGIG